jgi:hypothetical protein
VPAGYRFTLVLTQDIDTSTAAAGDAVAAKLATAIREGSKVFVPEGAAVRGRIVRIERSMVPLIPGRSSSSSRLSKPEG